MTRCDGRDFEEHAYVHGSKHVPYSELISCITTFSTAKATNQLRRVVLAMKETIVGHPKMKTGLSNIL